jgi:diadenosine tetraphosphatase ApaH/serine/threonine PP2A family protein phosphatase
MLYALVSDIHANLQAWTAVLLDIRSQKVGRIICLGDVVGYGPSPAEVMRSVHGNVNDLVLGNHDAVICGKMDPELFTGTARDIVLWTRDQLNSNAMRFLRGCPLSLTDGFFRCAHGDFSQPAAFNYILEPADALPSWQAVDNQLLFVGHSHVAALYLLGQSGQPHVIAPQDFEIEEGKRYIVNVGSVGQPRDGEARACYCLYDTATRSVFWRRVPFDLDQYRAALRQAGIPETGSYFLRHDPLLGTPPVRELLSFSPAKSPEQAVKDTVEVQELCALKRRLTRWKSLAVAGLLLGALVGGLSGLAWWKAAHRHLTIAGVEMAAVGPGAVPQGENILPMPTGAVEVGQPIVGWSVCLGDRRRQEVAVTLADSRLPMFVLSSLTVRDEVRIVSVPVRVQPGARFCVEALFRKDKRFAGNVAAVVSLTRRSGEREEAVDQFRVKAPNQPRADGWVLAKDTFRIPANAVLMDLQIRGRFTGAVEVRNVKLYRAK